MITLAVRIEVSGTFTGTDVADRIELRPNGDLTITGRAIRAEGSILAGQIDW